MPKKVLYIWQGDYPWDVRVEKFCEHLISCGDSVTLLARWREGQAEEEILQPGLRVVRVGCNRPRKWSVPIPWNPLWRARVRSEIASGKYDLVIAREILLVAPAVKPCRKANIPLVIDMAEHYPATMRAFEKYQQHPLLRLLVFNLRVPDWVERRAVQLADGVITVCEEQNQRLNATLGCPWERMAIVHNSPDLGMFSEVRPGPTTPPRVFAYHGHMTGQRGLAQLIDGFAQVANTEPAIRLDLAGGGDALGELQRQAANLGVSDRVRFIGPYPFETLPDLYSEADVGMVTYPIEESVEHTIGNKVFDYMACGKPVIVTPLRPLQRVVEESKCGIVLKDPSAEAVATGIRQMLAADCKQLGENGMAAAQAKYNWAHDARELDRFIRKILS